ncbi:MAG: alpha/beta fold hydrolase [Candidatus Binatia bacterium]
MRNAETVELEANGIRFSAYRWGVGPLVLCLHGFPDNAHSFRHQVAPLVSAGYRVVAPYMRGYAPSSAAPDGVYQSAALSRDVVALIEALGEEDAVVFGHDWGALAAYGAAAFRPERVKKLVAAAVPYGPSLLNAFATDYEQQKRSWYMFFFQLPLADVALAHDDYVFVRKLWRDWSPGWDFPEEEMDSVRATLAQPGVAEAALAYYRCMYQPELQSPELADEQAALGMVPINVPTLYLHGESDGCLSGELLEGMESMFPSGLITRLVKGAGHFVHREKPEEVNRALLDFLAS